MLFVLPLALRVGHALELAAATGERMISCSPVAFNDIKHLARSMPADGLEAQDVVPPRCGCWVAHMAIFVAAIGFWQSTRPGRRAQHSQHFSQAPAPECFLYCTPPPGSARVPTVERFHHPDTAGGPSYACSSSKQYQ